MTGFALLLLMGAAGCHHRVETGVDPTLPEEQLSVERQAPRVVLEEAAASEDPSLRAQSLRRLIEATGEDEWIQRGLFDPQDWVRRQAVRTLWASDREDKQQLLEAFAARPEVDPYTTAMVASWLPPSEALADTLKTRIGAVPEAWQRPPLQLAQAYQAGTDPKAALENLEMEILDADLHWMLAAAEHLDGSAVPVLRKLGRDAEPSLELVLAAGRLALGDASAEGVFRGYLADEDPMMRLEALDVLLALEGPPVVALLRRTAASGLDVTRWTARLGLVSLGEEDVSVLAEAASHSSVEVRLAAMLAAERGEAKGTWLSKRAQRGVQAAVEPCLSDPAAPVRAAALRAAAVDTVSEAVLLGLLQDENEAVRVEAAAHLLRRNGSQ